MYLSCSAVSQLLRILVCCLVSALFNFLFTLSDNSHISASSLLSASAESCFRYAANLCCSSILLLHLVPLCESIMLCNNAFFCIKVVKEVRTYRCWMLPTICPSHQLYSVLFPAWLQSQYVTGHFIPNYIPNILSINESLVWSIKCQKPVNNICTNVL